jgi:hypothetical protein
MERRSFRLPEIAKRNSLSVAFVYNEAAEGRLRVRKAGRCSIVTAEDETAWLDAMPMRTNDAGVADADTPADQDAPA